MNIEAMKTMMKPYVWGVVSGACVLLIVIFSTGWVVTSSSAQTVADETASEAVVARLAPICVTQFQQDPNKVDRLKELMKIDSWKQDEYVKNIGWATMPGAKEASGDVAVECTKRILALNQTSK